MRRARGHVRAVMVVADVTPLRLAHAALEGLNQNLEDHVQIRTHELESTNSELQNEIARRESAEEALRQSRNELELLSQQLIQAQELERRRIARELHDSVGPSLSAIKYSLERGAELHRQSRHADTQPLLGRTIQLVRAAIADIRSIAMDLRPPVLDDLGVASALEWLSREFGETYAHIGVHTRIDATDADIPPHLATTIFRCAQELLNNVAKHSKAHHVSVTLSRDPSRVTLIVCDDGVGLPNASASGSFGTGHGIRNLRERAQMTGGTLTLSADQGCGTLARLDWRFDARPPGRLDRGAAGLEVRGVRESCSGRTANGDLCCRLHSHHRFRLVTRSDGVSRRLSQHLARAVNEPQHGRKRQQIGEYQFPQHPVRPRGLASRASIARIAVTHRIAVLDAGNR